MKRPRAFSSCDSFEHSRGSACEDGQRREAEKNPRRKAYNVALYTRTSCLVIWLSLVAEVSTTL